MTTSLRKPLAAREDALDDDVVEIGDDDVELVLEDSDLEIVAFDVEVDVDVEDEEANLATAIPDERAPDPKPQVATADPVEPLLGILAPPTPRARRLSIPEIKLVEDDVADAVMASLGAEASRARESDRFRARVASVPPPPRPPAPPRADAEPPPSRLPPVRLPPVSPPPRLPPLSERTQNLKMAPPPPPSYSDLEETLPYAVPSPAANLECAERRPPKETPSAFVRGSEAISEPVSSVAPVALQARSARNDRTVVVLRRKPRASAAAAAAVVGAVAAVLLLRVALPSLFTEADANAATRTTQAIVAPLPRMKLPSKVTAKEVRFDERQAVVVGAAPAPPPSASAPAAPIAPGSPAPAHAPSPPKNATPSVPMPPKLPDGSLALGARVDSPPPKPTPAAAPAKTEPPAAAPKKLTPEQELAEAQLKASMR